MQSRVRIGYQADFAPFMVDDDGPRGLVIDRLMPLLEAADRTVEWIPLRLEHQMQALSGGAVDMLAGLGVTAERAETLAFGPCLVQTGGALFRVVGASGPIGRIATPSAGPLRRAVTEAFPDAELVEVADYAAALEAAAEQRVDAVALNVHVGADLADRLFPGVFAEPGETFAPVDLAPAARPDHPIAAWLARL